MMGESPIDFAALLERVGDVVFRYRLVPDRGVEYINAAVGATLGYAPDEFVADPDLPLRIVHAEDRPILERILDEPDSVAGPVTLRWLHRDGETVWIEQRIAPVRDASGAVVAIEGIARDVTASRLTADALRRQSELLGILHEAGALLGQALDEDQVFRTMWRTVARLMDCDGLFLSRYSADDHLIRCVFAQMEGEPLPLDQFPPIPLEPEGKGTQSRVIRSGQPLLVDDYQALMRTSQTAYYVDTEGGILDEPLDETEEVTRSALIVPMKLEDRVVGVVQVFSTRPAAYTEEHLRALEALVAQTAAASTNALLYERAQREVAERREAEAELRRGEERFRLVARATSDAVWDWDLGSDTVWWSEGHAALFGVSGEEARAGRGWGALIHPEDRERVVEGILEALGQARELWTDEYRYRRADGSYAAVLDRAYILRDESGRATRMLGALSDVTERRQLEQQLHRAQRLESVGRLAGGVAHDFNNLLNVILGYGELAAIDLPSDHPAQEALREIRDAAERAATLSRQLLTFARGEAVEARPFDLNALVGGMDAMLRRLIGEDIELVTAVTPEAATVVADPGQIEQVVANLAVNARDAMPDGGRLRIETALTALGEELAGDDAGLDPGVYATLTVSDTGTGMDEETLAHAFEPFFTTKEAGAGTGLGLATSYGIARRASGSITIESEPGRGTTVRVYLPYHAGPAAEVAAIREAAGPPRGDETILLVEDEAAVRRLAISALEGLGYAVLGASDGVDAIRVAREHRGRIDLLVTDVVMPRMGGAAVAQHLARRRPELRVLFTSGYTGDALARSDVMETGWSFLAKPYTPTVLARRVREVLDARR